MLDNFLATVYDAGPTLIRDLVDVSCFHAQHYTSGFVSSHAYVIISSTLVISIIHLFYQSQSQD